MGIFKEFILPHPYVRHCIRQSGAHFPKQDLKVFDQKKKHALQIVSNLLLKEYTLSAECYVVNQAVLVDIYSSP